MSYSRQDFNHSIDEEWCLWRSRLTNNDAYTFVNSYFGDETSQIYEFIHDWLDTKVRKDLPDTAGELDDMCCFNAYSRYFSCGKIIHAESYADLVEQMQNIVLDDMEEAMRKDLSIIVICMYLYLLHKNIDKAMEKYKVTHETVRYLADMIINDQPVEEVTVERLYSYLDYICDKND